jgi:hypothetical protein
VISPVFGSKIKFFSDFIFFSDLKFFPKFQIFSGGSPDAGSPAQPTWPRFRVAAPSLGLPHSRHGPVSALQHRRMAASAHFSPAQPFFGHFSAVFAWQHRRRAPTRGRFRLLFHRSAVFRPFYGAAPTRGSIRSFFPAFRPFFGHFTWQRRRKAPTRGTDGAMYTHGHVHEGAPILKTLPP